MTWLWGSEKYGPSDVAKLHAGIKRNLKQPHRFVCIADRPLENFDTIEIPQEDRHLLTVQGCFVRLRMFDPGWQSANGFDDRLVCIDLDSVVTGPLDPLFDRSEPFVILQGGNAANPCPYGGALMMLRPGAHPQVWSEFSLEAADKIPRHEFADDQGWIAHKVPGAAGWKCGTQSGVYVFRKPGWPSTSVDRLPAGARLVTFNGWRSPEKFKHLGWIRNNWAA